MIKNYLLLSWKHLRKQKLFSFINIMGLTIGITCCLMIFLFILNECSYDNFHSKGKDIYRVYRVAKINGEKTDIPYLSPSYSTALLNDYPEDILKAVRVMPDNDLIRYGNTAFNEQKIYLADSNFFQLFDFPLLQGNPATVLSQPSNIVLTASTAKKYFGTDDPIGKILKFNEKMEFRVAGIAKDVPLNSHLNFDFVVPISNWRNEDWFKNWNNNSLFVYVQLNPSISPASLTAKFPRFMDKYMGDIYKEIGFKMGLMIKPLRQIYFEEASPFDHIKHGNQKMVYLFMSIAVLILIIACINFMNLSTAKAADRSKEVGLRKVLGAERKQLMGQFIAESVLYAALATLLAILLLQLLMPAYNRILGYELPAYWSNPWLYLCMLGIILVVGLLAGSYPAFLLSSFKPIESLKGKMKAGKQGAFFRKVLVIFQFGISVLLIVSITIIVSQLQYVKSRDLGFNKAQSMIVKLDNNSIWDKKTAFKIELQHNSQVESVSLMSGEPGGFHDFHSFETEANPNEKQLFNTEFADFEFVKTLDLHLIAGRDFSASFPTDSAEAVLINRTAAVKMGYTPEQAIGKWMKDAISDKNRRKIIGVVENYHYASLKEPIGPLVISNHEDRRLALIRLKPGNLATAINIVGKSYEHYAANYPFEFSFLDYKLNQLYQSEIKQETIFSIFSIIAIVIACLGLFGLTAFTALKRKKEIGVRKVLGSSNLNIVTLLSKDMLQPVLIGTLLAFPIGYYAMTKWLQQFAYKIDIVWWMFALAGFLAILIALITVGFQAIKAAVANPVENLRTE